MGYLIGTDEAGYGPKLGPLVVVATVWKVPEETLEQLAEVDLFERFAPAVIRPGGQSKARYRPAGNEPIVMGDSKSLYASGDSLAKLETAALALWQAGQDGDAGAVFGQWLIESPRRAWSVPPVLELPLDTPIANVLGAKEILEQAFAATACCLAGVAAKVMYPPEFNQGCAMAGNKATLLSQTTLQLAAAGLAEAESRHGPAEAMLLCDKHGGRGSYAELLPAAFHELQAVPPHVLREKSLGTAGRRLFADDPPAGPARFETHAESREQSVYRWSAPPTPRREIRFTAKGEHQLPTAAASIFAKLLREIAIRWFNRFWSGEVEGLHRTAGYPADADRFLADIEPARQRLKIERGEFVRDR